MRFVRLFSLAAPLALASAAFAQTAQTRIPQQIVMNGQTASGAYVAAPGGGMQSFTCSSPQQYTTANGASTGWACYEAATGVWLLNAIPPSSAPAAVQAVPAPVVAPAPVVQQVVAPPAVVYQPAPAVIYQQPAIVYATPVYAAPAAVIVAPVYSPQVIFGAAAINAAGRIVSAAVIGSRHYEVNRFIYTTPYRYEPPSRRSPVIVYRHR